MAARIARAARQLRAGGLMLSASMNGFYGLKRLTGNLPAEARDQLDTPRIARPAPSSDPARISLRIARPAPTRELASGEQ